MKYMMNSPVDLDIRILTHTCIYIFSMFENIHVYNSAKTFAYVLNKKEPSPLYTESLRN